MNDIKHKKNLETIVNKEYMGKYLNNLLMFERPILKSLRRHYERMPYFNQYSLSKQDAEYMAIMNHAGDMRIFYEKKYLPKLNLEMAHVQKRIRDEDTKSENDESESEDE